MERKFHKRNLLLLTLLAPVGCGLSREFSTERCENVLDAASRSACRKKQIQSSFPARVTVGMVVGAALGAGFAVAVRQDPIVGAMIGGVAMGTITAAERYVAYKLEQANGETALAIQLAAKDLAEDNDRLAHAVADQNIAIEQLDRAFNKLQATYRDRLALIDEAQEVNQALRDEIQVYTITRDIYDKIPVLLEEYKNEQYRRQLTYLHNKIENLTEMNGRLRNSLAQFGY